MPCITPPCTWPFDDHRVDDIAEIVDRGELNDLGDAGRRIDLHLANEGAGRIGQIGRIEIGLLVEPRLDVVRQLVEGIGRQSDLGEA